MPKNNEIKSVLLIGSGPITIGQACEFDYSGVQAIQALKEEGIRVILVNSNPATVMTDLDMADRTYIEPLSASFISRIIAKERPDALLPTMGGQTALNLSLELQEKGVLDEYNVKLIGAQVEAIRLGEDREAFKELMDQNGLDTCKGQFATNIEKAREIVDEIGLPVVIRPSFTLGGTGGGIAETLDQFEQIAAAGLAASPNSQILVEESLIGWKEFEFEVIRDKADNAIIVCSIENIDAMGVHTGDSMTVAPAQTLSDKMYQNLRNQSLQVLRLVGVETGGSNVQFAVHPETDRCIVIEMNPRVSRSSALASKATGYPIAKVATKLALGYTLNELTNEITKTTPASFEPTLDYVVVKIPRWAFEKFPKADSSLTTQMKSVGEVMAIGRTFKEAMQKAIQSLEIGFEGFGSVPTGQVKDPKKGLSTPHWQRLHSMNRAFYDGWSLDQVALLTLIDRWFLSHFKQIVDLAKSMENKDLKSVDSAMFTRAKRWGLSDKQLAALLNAEESQIRQKSEAELYGFKAVDTCAAEFPAETPYLYGTYGEEGEIDKLSANSILILGSGPNRIGQGIEFDYSCVQAIRGFQKADYKVIMVNNNPETVSTDFDCADRLYFEPLNLERVLQIIKLEQPMGVVVSFGGQTALNLAEPLHDLGIQILGTTPYDIDRAENRKAFAALCQELNIKQATHKTAHGKDEALAIARDIGFPVMVRPSFVLGGRAMDIAFDETDMLTCIQNAIEAMPNQPILIDSFLDDAIEVDVDALCDGDEVMICGVMQHIEAAGHHSGDSSCVLPSALLTPSMDEDLRKITRSLALALKVIGPLNVQYAIHQDEIYIIEANPRCARTVPFAAKACGLPYAQMAAQLMIGKKLKELSTNLDPKPAMWHVKSPVFPFNKLAGEDPITGPEMKSTGEVMGSAHSFGSAFAKAYRATGHKLPRAGQAFISVNDRDKPQIAEIGRGLYQLGFELLATSGTGAVLKEAGLPVQILQKVYEGKPNVKELIQNKLIRLVVNTPIGKESHHDDRYIRWEAMKASVPCITTLSAARALIEGIRAIKSERLEVFALQDWLP